MVRWFTLQGLEQLFRWVDGLNEAFQDVENVFFWTYVKSMWWPDKLGFCHEDRCLLKPSNRRIVFLDAATLVCHDYHDQSDPCHVRKYFFAPLLHFPCQNACVSSTHGSSLIVQSYTGVDCCGCSAIGIEVCCHFQVCYQRWVCFSKLFDLETCHRGVLSIGTVYTQYNA